MVKNIIESECIDVGCASNDNYAQHMGVMIYSLLENCSCPEKVRFFVLGSEISSQNRARLESISKKFGSKMIFLNADMSLLKNIKTYRHLGVAAYLRFQLIDGVKVKKLIYLDCDIVVEGDIKSLFDIDIGDNILLAVRDPGIPASKKKLLNMSPGRFYFNSGVLVINCDKWKSENVTRQVLAYIEKDSNKIEFADQDALNVILSKSWKQIDISWNVITRFFYSKIFPWIKIYDYSKEEIKRVNKNQKIIHYATTIKPWFFLDVNPLKKRYWYYLKKTPWRDYRAPDSSFLGMYKRMGDYLDFVLSKGKYLWGSKMVRIRN